MTGLVDSDHYWEEERVKLHVILRLNHERHKEARSKTYYWSIPEHEDKS